VLVIGRRSRKERLRSEEASALVDVAHRADGLLSAQRLSSDLQRSYAQVLEVREQERLRLRRDLHDGIGPSLAGVALQLEGLAERLDDPALVARAERARDRLLTTVGDVRRIVDGLRPAAVEQLGLAAALRALATDEGDPVRVAVELALPAQLPGPVEVAAYRIVGEAVTNALRHAAARTVCVEVRQVGGELHVEVCDDGAGMPVPVQPGVGLSSMQERAREVGGRFEVGPSAAGGTRVLAVLPA
jgi:signal transduction histidine kinase